PAILLMSSFQVFAETNKEVFIKEFENCASEVGIPRPEGGSKLSKVDRKKINTCLAGKGITKPKKFNRMFRAAKKECIRTTGIAPREKGKRRSPEAKAKLRECLKK